MTDDYVQVNVRMTSSQRDKLKSIANKNDTSMNQFILDQTFTDRTDDRTLIEVLKERLDKQDDSNSQNEKGFFAKLFNL